MFRIGVIGGTGFVGTHLVEALVRQIPEAEVEVLSRSSPTRPLPAKAVWKRLDVRDAKGLKGALSGAGAVYYLPGILAESREQKYEEIHYEGVVRTLEALSGSSGCPLFHVSAVGAALNAPSMYHRTKKRAEEAIQRSGLPYTIVRPSLVFGHGDKSINQFLSFGKALHLLPMIGPGTARVQPVWAGDLARMLALLPGREGSRGKVYEAGGPRIYTYREMMTAIRASAGLKASIVPAPIAVMMLSGMLQKALLPRPFLTPDVIRMALSDNVTAKNALVADFSLDLTSLESYLESEAR